MISKVEDNEFQEQLIKSAVTGQHSTFDEPTGFFCISRCSKHLLHLLYALRRRKEVLIRATMNLALWDPEDERTDIGVLIIPGEHQSAPHFALNSIEVVLEYSASFECPRSVGGDVS